MPLQIQNNLQKKDLIDNDLVNLKERVFSKDYVELLNEAGWRLEKKLPSNTNHYSDLLEDTDWNYTNIDMKSTKHYRRDLDALS